MKGRWIFGGELGIRTQGSFWEHSINKPVGPYFRQRNLTLRELEARHLQMFYSEMLRKVKPNTVIHYHAIIHSALKYAVKTDMLVQNVADKVDRPKKNSFQPVFLSAEEMQKMFEALRRWLDSQWAELPEALPTQTAAELVGHSPQRIHEWIRQEVLVGIKLGTIQYCAKAEFVSFMASPQRLVHPRTEKYKELIRKFKYIQRRERENKQRRCKRRMKRGENFD